MSDISPGKKKSPEKNPFASYQPKKSGIVEVARPQVHREKSKGSAVLKEMQQHEKSEE